MLQKQLVQVTKDILHFMFYWDDYTINQVFMGATLVLVFGKSIMLAGADTLQKWYTIVREGIAADKERYDNDVILMFDARTIGNRS